MNPPTSPSTADPVSEETAGSGTLGNLSFSALLALAPLIWGFGFVATRLTLAASGPLWSNALRFGLASLVMVPVVATRGFRLTRAQVASGALLGVLLFLAFSFQTTGLVTTSVSHSSFITGLYAVATPLLAPFFGRWPKPMVIGASALAVFGLWLLTTAHPGQVDLLRLGSELGRGDLITLGCAITSAIHILLADRVTPGADSISLNFVQLATVSLIALPAALLLEGRLQFAPSSAAIFGLVYLATLSSGLAFTIQLVAQKRVSPSVAAMIFLLEAPLGALAGTLFDGDHLTGTQWVGAGVMTLASLIAVRSQ
jgi:drug/metabolite transporter (DMT)-like permease